MEKFNLFDAEFRFVRIVWDHEPVNSTELSRICLKELGWKKSTTFNMIRKLVDRGILQNDKATVTSLIKLEQVQKYESEVLLKKKFSNSLPTFIATFLKDRKLSKEEAEEIKSMIEESTR